MAAFRTVYNGCSNWKFVWRHRLGLKNAPARAAVTRPLGLHFCIMHRRHLMFYQCNFESRPVTFPSPFPLRYKAFFSNAVKSAAVKDSGTGLIQSSNGPVGLPLFISSLLRCPIPAINAPIFAESNAFGAVFSTACRQFCPFSLPQRFISPSRSAPQTLASRPQYPAERIH